MFDFEWSTGCIYRIRLVVKPRPWKILVNWCLVGAWRSTRFLKGKQCFETLKQFLRQRRMKFENKTHSEFRVSEFLMANSNKDDPKTLTSTIWKSGQNSRPTHNSTNGLLSEEWQGFVTNVNDPLLEWFAVGREPGSNRTGHLDTGSVERKIAVGTYNVGIAIINHPVLMVHTIHWWWLEGWFIIAIPTLFNFWNYLSVFGQKKFQLLMNIHTYSYHKSGSVGC